MARKIALLLAVVLLISVGTAVGDWDPGHPAKWVQLPDEATTGIDVNASFGLILADDFECRHTGYITAIHIWGSWRDELLPCGRPDSVYFTLSIHDDIPDSESTTGYSMPGEVRWYRTYGPGEFTSRIYNNMTREGWYDPPSGEYVSFSDSTIWQYNFFIPAGEQFYQEGLPDEPIVYWLNVQAEPFTDETRFGWKTSLEHWNDDAVWVNAYEPYYGIWYELIYPADHPMGGQSIDLAFVIVGDEEADVDWSDAPDSPVAPGYPTLAIHNGANHAMGGPWLGDTTDFPDPEVDGQPDPDALGDDNDANDDEDGVTIPILVPGVPSTIEVVVSGGGGNVTAWIDFNSNQNWDHPAEQVFSGWLPNGTHTFNVTTPGTAVVGPTFARFRISTTAAGGLPIGAASDGEVEDHKVIIREPGDFKWMQGPDLTPNGIDVNATDSGTAPHYLLADDFPCTEQGRITEIHIWASWLYDWIPYGDDPLAVDFTLSFHKDIPASESPTGYSMPGGVEWYRDFVPGEFEALVWLDSIPEGWLNPPIDYWFPADDTCWLYKFYVDADEAFFQRGTEEDTVVYWLDVQAYPHDPDAWFGWKTSIKHWNDDAVWVDGQEPYSGDWNELRYPPGHEMYGQSIDLAFRLVMDPISGTRSDKATLESSGFCQNMPNPFRSSTAIRYSLAARGHVKLDVFDIVGRLVNTLVDDVQEGGVHNVTWSGRDREGSKVPAGVYFYRLSMGDQKVTRKMLYLK